MAASAVRRRGERVFEKELSKTDVECRFAFPSKHIHHIVCNNNNNNNDQSSLAVDFQVDDFDGRLFQLRLNIRSGRHKKPEVTKGWLNMVRNKRLKKHDKVIFYNHPDGDDFHFTVAVKRAVLVFEAVIGHKAAEE